MTKYSYKIAAGWNNAAGLTNVESISVAGATYTLNQLSPLLAIHHRLDASTHFFLTSSTITVPRVTVSTGVTIQRGRKVQEWVFPFIGDDALEHWRDNYVGKMTIATKSDSQYDVYANYSANLDYPQTTRDQRVYIKGVWVYRDVIVPIQLVAAL